MKITNILIEDEEEKKEVNSIKHAKEKIIEA